MNYNQYTNAGLNEERNNTITEIHTLNQEFDGASKDERLGINRDLGILYTRRFEIEREIQRRGRQAVEQDGATIMRQAANMTANGVSVGTHYDSDKFNQFLLRIELFDPCPMDLLNIYQELCAAWGREAVFYTKTFGTVQFEVSVTYDWMS